MRWQRRLQQGREHSRPHARLAHDLGPRPRRVPRTAAPAGRPSACASSFFRARSASSRPSPRVGASCSPGGSSRRVLLTVAARVGVSCPLASVAWESQDKMRRPDREAAKMRRLGIVTRARRPACSSGGACSVAPPPWNSKPLRPVKKRRASPSRSILRRRARDGRVGGRGPRPRPRVWAIATSVSAGSPRRGARRPARA